MEAGRFGRSDCIVMNPPYDVTQAGGRLHLGAAALGVGLGGLL